MPHPCSEKTQKVKTIEVTLPMEIISTEIFPRLPAKSLLRFKCVSKFFYTLISSPEFINLQLCHSQSSNANGFIVFSGFGGSTYIANLDSPSLELSVVNLPRPLVNNFGGTSLVGSCNGLLCLHALSSQYFILLNPLTRMYRKILVSGEYQHYSSFPKPYLNNRVHCSFGFGGDGNDDYKIVKIIEYIPQNCDDVSVKERDVLLYSLKSDSWTLASKTCSSSLDSMFGMDNNGALIDNHLVHWRFWNSSEFKHRIGCFDLADAQWGKDVPLPSEHVASWAMMQQSQSSRAQDWIRLGVLDGCLCLSAKYDSRLEADVWVMKEYRVKESWFKFLHISNSDVAPLVDWMVSPFDYCARRSSNELLVRDESKLRFFWYNIAEKTYKNLSDKNIRVSSSKFCLFNMSLVTIPGGKPIV